MRFGTRPVAALQILLLVFECVPASATSLVPCLQLDAQHISEISAKYDFIAYVKIKRRVSSVVKLFRSKHGETFRTKIMTIGYSTIAAYEVNVVDKYQDRSWKTPWRQRSIVSININGIPYREGESFLVLARKLNQNKGDFDHFSASARKVVTKSDFFADICGTPQYNASNASILEKLEKN